MSRIASAFKRLESEGRKALIPYFTAGDPDLASVLPIMREMVAAGADVIELGVPFSDPMAEGPTIQRAMERALANKVSMRQVLECVREFRKSDQLTPIVMMGYANPVEAMGAERFADLAQDVGLDGVLLVDYPPEECETYAALLKARGLDPIFLLAPTSVEQRYSDVAKAGSGYIYYVSLKGVTGAGNLDVAEVASRIPLIRERVGMPVGVGFGIRDAASAKSIAAIADAVVIGSRVVEEIEASPRGEEAARVGAFLRGIRVAMDETKTEGAKA
jgi:tryptophan synthase alpha chain